MKNLAIIGACGHGKVLADIAEKMGYQRIVFYDDYKAVKDYGGYSIEGKSNDAFEYDGDVIVAIGNAKIRQQFIDGLMYRGVKVPTLIHPNAVIASDVVIGEGTVVMAGGILQPGSIVGQGCIINTASSIDHDSQIGDYVHLAVGAHVAGEVQIGSRTWIGTGATISNNVHICGECMIGAGAVVVKDIENPGVYIGVPAKKR